MTIFAPNQILFKATLIYCNVSSQPWGEKKVDYSAEGQILCPPDHRPFLATQRNSWRKTTFFLFCAVKISPEKSSWLIRTSILCTYKLYIHVKTIQYILWLDKAKLWALACPSSLICPHSSSFLSTLYSDLPSSSSSDNVILCQIMSDYVRFSSFEEFEPKSIILQQKLFIWPKIRSGIF